MLVYNQMTPEEFVEKTKYLKTTRHFDPIYNEWHMLYNYKLKRPMAVSLNISVINKMMPYVQDVNPWYWMKSIKNYFGNSRVTKDFRPRFCWNFQYNPAKEVFEPAQTELEPGVAYQFALAQEKTGALDIVHNRINYARMPLRQDLYAQDVVYKLKEEEAQKILQFNNVDIDPSNFPFISGYADVIGADIKVAAREILLKSSHQKELLADTEFLKTKYAHAILQTKEIIEVAAIVEEFRTAMRVYPLV